MLVNKIVPEGLDKNKQRAASGPWAEVWRPLGLRNDESTGGDPSNGGLQSQSLPSFKDQGPLYQPGDGIHSKRVTARYNPEIQNVLFWIHIVTLFSGIRHLLCEDTL